MTDPTNLLLLVKVARQRVDKLRADLAQAEQGRDDIIRQAYAAAVPADQIADAAELHVKRIYQIRRAGSASTTD